MKYLVSLWFFFICISCGPKDTGPQGINKKLEESAEDQIKHIMSIWPGTYNNDGQIRSAKEKGEAVWHGDADNGGWLNVHSHYIALEKPEIGENLLYVEEYRDGNPKMTYRQRIYKLQVDSSGIGRVVMCTFKDKEKYLGAYTDLSKLDSLTYEDIGAYPPKCDLIISKEGDTYHMVMNDKDCTFGDRYFNYEVTLKEGLFSYRDKIVQLSNDSLLTTAANFQFHHLDKIE